MPVRIVIADDHEAARRGMRSLLACHADWLVCADAADGVEATELARQLRPDVILMDISMPRMDGIEATRIIHQQVPESQVIIVSQNDPVVLRQQAREIGAAAWVAKSKLGTDLIPTLQETIANRNRDTAGETSSSPRHFSNGGGEMGERIRSLDWSKTILGPVDRWPESLKTAVRICIGSRNPIVVWWGRSALSQFYNDAYISFLGSKKHPVFLGQSARECWSEIWETVGPMLERVFTTGDATWSEDLLLVLNRNLPREEGYFTFSYSPIWNDAGTVDGIFCACYETTARVIGDRRLRTLRDLGRTVSAAKTSEEACNSAAKILESNPADIPFALLYLLDDDERRARLTARAGFAGESAASPAVIDLTAPADASVWPLKQVLDTGSVEVVSNLSQRFERLPGGAWPESPESAVVVPIASGQSRPTGFLVAGLSPRRIVDSDYLSFFDLIVGHVSTAIANSRAYEEERKRAEALAEIDRAKTLFFSNVSHEFRTPLTLMLGPLEDALSVRDGLAADQRERLEVAHRNSLRLLKLVNTLLDFSRIEAGRIQACYEPIDLAAFTSDLASVFRSAVERAGLRLIINCEPIAELVYVDREMWEKIVFNLISNAFKFTFAGEIEIGLRNVDGRVELIVRDTGTGVPPKDLPHLFERFYRVKGAQGRSFEGSGIGLALVQELAQLHGGSVRVDSKVDQGSIFTITIPLGKNHLPADRIGAERSLAPTDLRGEAFVQEVLRWLPDSQRISDEIQLTPLLSVAAALPPSDAGQARPRILLADDNADMREYVRKLLQEQFEVVTAPDGQSALESARQRHPDLVLADLMMPRLDGFGLLQALRAEDDLKTIPIILVSARAGEESRIEGLRAGADDYLAKPFSARELSARVESQLRLAGLRRHAAELERELRTKAELERGRFREMIDALPAAVYTTDAEGRLTHFNPAAVKFSGREPQLGSDQWCVTWKLFYPDGRPMPHDECPMAIALKEGRIIEGVEAIAERPDGTRRWFTPYPTPLRDSQGNIIGGINMLLDITERKEAERITSLLSAIVSSSDDAIISKNLDGTITTWNKGAEQIFGYTAHEAVGQNITLIVPWEHRAEEEGILRRLAQGGRFDHFETVRRRKDASTLDVSLTISPIRDSNDRVIGASNVARDITERKRAEQALRESEEQLAAEADALADLNEWSGRLWRSRTLNEGLDEILAGVIQLMGADKGKIQLIEPHRPVLKVITQRGFQQDFLDFFHEVSITDNSGCGRALRSGERIVIEDIEEDSLYAPLREIARAAGYRAVVSTPLVDIDGTPLGVVSTHFGSVHRPTEQDLRRLDLYLRQASDFIRRRRTEERLQQSQERFQALVNATSYAVYRMSPDWSEMRQLDGKGFVSDTAKPRKDWLDEYIHPDDQPLLLKAIRETVRTKKIFQLEHRVRRTDGTLGWTYSRAVPIMNEKGEIIEWFGAASDVTARKEVEDNYRNLADTLDAEVRARTRELEQRNAQLVSRSEQVRKLSWQLLHTQDEERRHIARELHDSAGQTLALLGMNLGSLAAQAHDQQPEFKQSLEEANDLIQQLTKEIRTMSYLLHPPLLDENGLPAALSWYISGLADRSSVNISFNISEEFGRLPGDMELTIFRLIQECLTNIHRHSGSKTAVLQVLREEDRVLVEVRDQGKGIPAEKLAEIQTKGSGVGIRGMRERLREFGGEMIIDSTITGTTVLVTIPMSRKRRNLSSTARGAESSL
jgi:PAS domain S-box-containing protein